MLFRKYLDDYESDEETAEILNRESYSRIIGVCVVGTLENCDTSVT